MRRIPGFTLLEQLLVLAITALVATLAIPDLSKAWRASTGERTGDALLQSIQFARTQAILNNQRMVLCASEDGRQCSDTNQWEQGWLIASQPHPTDQTNLLPRAFHTAAGRQTSIHAASSRTRIRFRPDGSAAGSNVTFTVCTAGRAVIRIILSSAGRVRRERLPDAPPVACP